jgi:uncharacterized protein
VQAEIRIVLDTNLWFRTAYNPDGLTGGRVEYLVNGDTYEILTSAEQEVELRIVLARRRYQQKFTPSYLETLWKSFGRSKLIAVSSAVIACRDLKDNYLLALAQDGEADFLLTLDEDLLVLKRWGQTTICTLEEFFQAQSGP